MKNLVQPLKIEDVTPLPGGTIGYTIYPKDPASPEELLKNADRALYQGRQEAEARGKLMTRLQRRPLRDAGSI